MKDEVLRNGDEPFAEKPSRTQKKKAAEALQKMGEQLVGLRDAQLGALALPPELHEAVTTARSMRSHGARRRQMQYIGSLMREVDALELSERLARVTLETHEESRRFKQAERWRDELLAGNAARQDWLVANYPLIDPQELARLIQAAGPATSPERSPRKSSDQRRKAGRALFRYLRQVIEQQDLG